MKQPVIYKIINQVNDKFYIGSTNNQYERFRTHRNKLRNNKHHCAHLQAAWNTYGEEKFVFKVIDVLVDEQLLQAAEDKWLVEWVGKAECYNHGLRSGAPWRGGAKELHPSYGKRASEETKQLIRDARYAQADPRLGTKHTEATKQVISEKKLANPTRAWLGKTRNEETRKKIGDAQRGVAKSPRIYTPEGLEKARDNMLKNANKQEVNTADAVIGKFPLETQQRYDFTNAIYTGALNRITGCKCKVHGEFSQYAAQFRKGRGCPECGGEERALSKKQQMLEAWSNPDERNKMMEARKKK